MQVAVIFGGRSTEYPISCMSAASVLRNIKNHDIVKIGISKTGAWYKTDASESDIEDGSWISSPTNRAVSICFEDGSLVWDSGRVVPDVVFPVLHGKNGEDGTIQGLLELMRVPYVGCGVLASAVCQDKAYANMMFERAGLKHTEWTSLLRNDFYGREEAVCDRISEQIGYPLFVKPSNAGSSIGVCRVDKREQLVQAVKLAFSYDRRVIIEKAVTDPQEIEVAVMGNHEPIASVSGQIFSSKDIYDFEAKYLSADTVLRIPSGSDKEEQIRAMALKAYTACDCRGLARVDFMVDASGEIFINEINTMPGFTSGSMYAKLFGASGVDYSDLVEMLLEFAVEDMAEREISI